MNLDSFLPALTLAFAVPLTFLIPFLHFFPCFLEVFFFSGTLPSLRLGSFFFALSKESEIIPKPVVLPPPKRVLNPHTNMTSGVVLCILASFSRISVLGCLPRGRTLMTTCFHWISLLVINFLVRIVSVWFMVMNPSSSQGRKDWFGLIWFIWQHLTSDINFGNS